MYLDDWLNNSFQADQQNSGETQNHPKELHYPERFFYYKVTSDCGCDKKK